MKSAARGYRVIENAYGFFVPQVKMEYRWPLRWLSGWEPLRADGPQCRIEADARGMVEAYKRFRSGDNVVWKDGT